MKGVWSLCRWHAEYQDLYVKKRIAMAEWRDHRNAERAAASVRAEAECAPARQDQAEHQKAVEEERLFRRVHWWLLGKWTPAVHEHCSRLTVLLPPELTLHG